MRLDIVAKNVVRPETATAVAWADPRARSILAALAYADLFDYPLTLNEIHRYQIGTSFSNEEIAHVLGTTPSLQSATSHRAGFSCLRGREAVFDTRRTRAAHSARVWRRARLYSRWLSRIPFVRMVAVTGALAVGNIATRPDIDVMLGAAEGRVWICRRLVIGLVRIGRLLGDDLCPNYIISETKLDLDQQDLFTAHELAQMVPLYGKRLYEKMLAQNSWARHFLPRAFPVRKTVVPEIRPSLPRRIMERGLSAHALDRWERWELRRLQRKLRPLVGDAAEVICSPKQCKGHTGLHRQWVTTRYSDRLHELGL